MSGLGEGNKLFSEEARAELGIKTVAEENAERAAAIAEGEGGGTPPAEGEGTPAATPEGEGQPAEGTEGQPPEGGGEQPIEFELEKFNTLFETKYENTDDIKGLIEAANKVSGYEEQLGKIPQFESDLKARDEEIKTLKESLDPLKYFSSDTAYKAEALRIQHPDKDPVMIEKVIKSDLSNTSDMNVLIDKVLLNTPSFDSDRARAEAIVRDKYGIEEDEKPEEWSQLTKDKMLMDANTARSEFKALAETVNLPEVISPEDRAAQIAADKAALTASWEEPLKSIAQYDKETLTDAEGNVLLEFDVPDEFKAGIKDYATALIDSGGLPVNKETLNFIESDIRKNNIASNITNILAAYKGKLESEWLANKDKEEGNDVPLNTDTAPPQEGELSGLEKFAAAGGAGS